MNLNWLHLSDLHLIYDNYDTTIMREQMIKYLTEKVAMKFDIVFITGDITHQGNNYNKAIFDFLDEILSALNVDKENVYIVPGNHDVKRTKIMERLVDSILSSTNPKDEINTIDEDSYQVLFKGHKNYFKFYESFLGREHPKENLHYVVKRDMYNIIHINTSLISGGNDVEGKILVGLKKLNEALRELSEKENSLNIAIGHHTINCINPHEKSSLLNRLSDNNIDFYLNGHVHRATYHQEINNYNKTYMFTAGANVVDGYAHSTFLTGSISMDDGSAKVVYHSWNKDDEFWHINNTIGRETVDGCYSCEIDRFKKKDQESPEYEEEVEISLPIKKVDEDEFKNFLIDFYDVIQKEKDVGSNLIPKDVKSKFINMVCSPTLKVQYDMCSNLFNIVNMILKSSAYVSIEKRLFMPNLIITEYMNILDEYENGDIIFKNILKKLVHKYKDEIHYSKERLELYISVLIFWSIYECNIYNEDKREKEVTV
ncbi:metallophosphoesterase family protein [Sutcliffiella horikoshii]|uniref:metallophosphoesterase family protein n=1 Tax=Sutcliffiella horikoshii TaxID=79883 RepID=UPI001F407586|nr:metallophosphoesterase [Sutcliffiella horikoshii]MCG1024034.1 metallophosphoesterase [Sutcliffiella horikoshii]